MFDRFSWERLDVLLMLDGSLEVREALMTLSEISRIFFWHGICINWYVIRLGRNRGSGMQGRTNKRILVKQIAFTVTALLIGAV